MVLQPVTAVTLLMVSMTTAYNRSRPQCRDAIIRECRRSTANHGYACPMDAENCIGHRSWCNGGRGNQWPLRVCPDFDNYHLTNCFSWNFKLAVGGRLLEYLFVWASVDWELAEMYCQFEGYHLLSLSSELEISRIRNRLKNFRLYETGMDRRSKVFDPMGLRCQAITWDLNVWIGIFYNHRAKMWQQTDGSPIIRTLNADIKLDTDPHYYRDYLDEFLKAPDESCYGLCTETAVMWKLNGTFSIHEKERFRRFSKITSKSHDLADAILCKRDTKKKDIHPWSGADKKSRGCITGFMCPDTDVCIIGYWYKESMLCDGKPDCPGGEDEFLSNCPHINATTSDGERKYLFFPMSRNYSRIRSFCSSYDFHLPSVHSPGDEDLLLSLPRRFGETFPEFDFRTQQRDWSFRDWYVTLGRNYSSERWEDGSEVNYTSHYEDINQFLPDMYLVLESGSPRPLTGHYIQDDAFVTYVFCQETFMLRAGISLRPQLVLIAVIIIFIQL